MARRLCSQQELDAAVAQGVVLVDVYATWYGPSSMPRHPLPLGHDQKFIKPCVIPPWGDWWVHSQE